MSLYFVIAAQTAQLAWTIWTVLAGQFGQPGQQLKTYSATATYQYVSLTTQRMRSTSENNSMKCPEKLSKHISHSLENFYDSWRCIESCLLDFDKNCCDWERVFFVTFTGHGVQSESIILSTVKWLTQFNYWPKRSVSNSRALLANILCHVGL